MFEENVLEMLPISSLNALEYCPRSFYYQVVQGEMVVNEAVLEGQLAHQRVHQPGTRTTEAGEIETTQLYLASETLHLTGFADVVEERAGRSFRWNISAGHRATGSTIISSCVRRRSAWKSGSQGRRISRMDISIMWNRGGASRSRSRPNCGPGRRRRSRRRSRWRPARLRHRPYLKNLPLAVPRVACCLCVCRKRCDSCVRGKRSKKEEERYVNPLSDRSLCSGEAG